MKDRKGEKIGWLGGWTGGFLWVGLIALFRLYQGKLLAGLLGMLIVACAGVCIVKISPWRYPRTAYWKLMLPIYAVLAAAVVWAFWAFGALGLPGRHWYCLWFLIPCASPMITIGRRRWIDGEPRA